MRIARCLATVFVLGVVLFGWAPGEESSYKASLSYSELISYGLVNAYSTNVLVQTAFDGKCVTKADALDAVKRNLAFVKVLERYAQSLKRGSTNQDEGMKKLVVDMCEVTTYLERQTESLKEWIAEPESKSSKILYQGYSTKVEKSIETMLTK